MKLKTSITILGGCLLIFLFIMLPIVFSIQEKKDNIVSSYSGSSFVLKDVNNKPITENSFQGPLTAIFFGFTNCPDICPTTLLDISRTLKELKDDAKKVQAVFVSVDYKRDTPQYLNKYVNYFDERILGISSDKKNIDKLNKYFKTNYSLLDSNKENYLVEHSSNLYIIGEDLVVKRIIAHGLPYTEITKAVKKLIN